jgi:hypothetical protein
MSGTLNHLPISRPIDQLAPKLSVTPCCVPKSCLGYLADHVQIDACEENTSSYLDKQLPGVCKQLPTLCQRSQGSAESVGLLIQTELADQLLL